MELGEGAFWRPRHGRPDPVRDPDGYMQWLIGDHAEPDGVQPISFPIIDEAYTIGPSAAPAQKRWFVVVTEPQKEKSVSDDLERDGIEPFVPKLKLFRRRRARSAAQRIAFTRPLLPRYVFAGLTEAAGSLYRVLEYRHAVDVLRRSSEAAMVPAEEIENLRLREAAGEFDETVRLKRGWGKSQPSGPYAWIEKGVEIFVLGGPFASFPATIEEVDAGRGIAKAGVMIFGRSTPVELEFAQFRAA